MFRVSAVDLDLGPVVIPAHILIEALAYAVGFAIYNHQRKRRGDLISQPNRNSVIVAAILGAAVGSRLLAFLEDPAALMWTGKTVVGGLLGGTIAVEWAKWWLGIQERTGDLFAIPIAVATAIGRLGCFFGGIEDHTYGTPANVPWAVDFGDGIARHPVQLYEIVSLLALVAFLASLRSGALRDGDLFRVFLTSYLAWRLFIDFWKPAPAFFGLATIQWACLAGIGWYSRDIIQIFVRRRTPEHG